MPLSKKEELHFSLSFISDFFCYLKLGEFRGGLHFTFFSQIIICALLSVVIVRLSTLVNFVNGLI